ncbi:MAG: hypothetical protein HN742_01525 [Lentisphaerae bacterium]|nr:hypothetical protein [Lentisphaerota bacterium]MBT4814277.1 hypothetical protein [Lentisphaerota bacterium]MBT5611059.1 hypothetical protein [Lentisphaerota bacterium]MBT7055314.1 hypothetical protein [Lentisphaerota bacterium]MBT7840515.1 hypothetical protein [Lentisphaerota bacterium]
MAIIAGHDDTEFPGLGADQLVIHGVAYCNSASMFWSRLLDEAVSFCGGCNGLRLSTTDEAPLDANLLAPEEHLEADAARLRDRELGELAREVMSILDFLGPPQPVRLVLLRNDREIEQTELVRECMDSSIFPPFVAWLLRWADVRPSGWNEEFIQGDFEAEDSARHFVYRVHFVLRRKDISEGLVERILTLSFAGLH